MANKDNNIDLCMTIICLITPYDHTWSREEIADMCGCSQEYIREIERKALNKLRRRSALKQYGIDYMNVKQAGGSLIGSL